MCFIDIKSMLLTKRLMQISAGESLRKPRHGQRGRLSNIKCNCLSITFAALNKQLINVPSSKLQYQVCVAIVQLVQKNLAYVHNLVSRTLSIILTLHLRHQYLYRWIKLIFCFLFDVSITKLHKKDILKMTQTALKICKQYSFFQYLACSTTITS